MKHSIGNNLRVWDRKYAWTQDGDEWIEQARACGQPYEAWKDSIVKTFIEPNVTSSSAVLEIAPGHGRWSREIAPRCSRLVLVDLSRNCIEHCRHLLRGHAHVEYQVTDGRSLPGVADGSIDFVWSYDSFVHMRKKVIEAYLEEIARVLNPGGLAVIHHPGRRHLFIPFRRFARQFPRGRRLYNFLTLGHFRVDDGWRSDVSRPMVRHAARRCGLKVEAEVLRWGGRNQFGVPLYRDTISTFRKAD